MSLVEYCEEISQTILTNSIGDLIEIFKEVISNGVELETVVNFLNSKNQSPLHLAASRLQDEFIRLLLENGADSNIQDGIGRTPVLHVVFSLKHCQCESCLRSAVRCVNLLGEYGANMDTTDETGESSLHMSAMLGLEELALALLNYGASLYKRNNNNTRKPMMTTLLEYIPDIILPIFDRSIKMNPRQRHHVDFHLSFDMSVIMIQGQNNCYFDKRENPEVPQREMGFLCQILNSSSLRDVNTYRSILQHPIVHIFTDIKWNRLKFIYFGYLFCQVNLLLLYILFLFMVIFVDCPVETSASIESSLNETSIKLQSSLNMTDIISKIKETIFANSKCEINIYTKLLGIFVLFCISIAAFKEIFHFATDFRVYIRDVFNLVQWVGLATMNATAVIALNPITLFHYWLFPLSSFGIGISWVQLFMHLGQMPNLGIYVDMLAKITINFCCSLAMYSCIIFAFAMSYTFLFPTNASLLDFPLAILRVMTMMLGELNYDSLFAPERSIRSPILGHIWYAIFLIVVSMVLMNLLVGLAVSDINRCRKDSELVVMQRKIRYLNYLEKSFYLGTMFIPKCFQIYLRNQIRIIPPITKTSRLVHCKEQVDEKAQKIYEVIVYPNKSLDSRFLSETTTAIRQWLVKQLNNGTTRETFCHKYQHLPKDQISRGVLDRGIKEIPQVTTRTGSSISVKSIRLRKVIEDDMKRLTKIENSLKRLENRFLDFNSKLDQLLTQHNDLTNRSNYSVE